MSHLATNAEAMSHLAIDADEMVDSQPRAQLGISYHSASNDQQPVSFGAGGQLPYMLLQRCAASSGPWQYVDVNQDHGASLLDMAA